MASVFSYNGFATKNLKTIRTSIPFVNFLPGFLLIFSMFEAK